MTEGGESTNTGPSQKLPPNWKKPTRLDDAGSSEKKSLTMTVLSKLKYPVSHKDPAENPERGNWNNRVEFVLSCMGFAIGLGNLWRFPYMVYENGGGSFLVAYVLMLVLVAFPNFLMELAIGQFSSSGPIKAYRNILPIVTGVGWLNLFQNLVGTCNYTSIMAYALFYLFSSFQAVMPWQTCKLTHNTRYCFASTEQRDCHSSNGYYFRTQCYTANSTNDYKSIIPRIQACLDDPQTLNPACVAQINIPFSKFTPKVTLSEWLKKTTFVPQDTFIDSVNIFLIKDLENLADPTKRYKPFKLSKGSDPITEDLMILLSHTDNDMAVNIANNVREFFNNDSLSGPGGSDLQTIIENTCELLGLKKGIDVDCLRQVVAEVDPRSVYSSEEYFKYYIQHKDTSFWNLQGLTWQMILCYYLAWCITGIGLVQGPKLMGKIVYFTAIFPIVMILVFVIYGATLSGKSLGYAFYLKTDWAKLADPKVWRDAASQIFFSLSIGGGGLMTLASYNIFHNDFVVDAGIVASANCLCSFISGFAVFAILGHMAEELGKTVPEVATSGMGLAFIAYSHATSNMPAGQLWAALWFLNLFILGIDSNFALMECFITWFCDAYPSSRNHKWAVVAIMSGIFSLLGLVNITRGGAYFLGMMDTAAYDFLLVLIVLSNVIMVSYFYGAQRFVRDIQMMLGMTIHGPNGRKIFGSLLFRKYSKWYSLISWYFISPVALGFIMISIFVNFADKKHMFTGTEELPALGKFLFWSVAGVSFPLIMITCGLYVKYRGKYSWKQMIKPTKQWGPALNQFREGIYEQLDTHSQTDENPGIIQLIKRKFGKEKEKSQQKDRTETPDRDIFEKPLFDDVKTAETQPTRTIKGSSAKSNDFPEE